MPSEDVQASAENVREGGRLLRMCDALRHDMRRLFHDRAGSAVIEFAMLIIPLLGLIFASFTVSLIYFTQSALDSVSDEMSRLLLTGQAPAAGQASDFKSLACANLPSFMSCSRLVINVQTANNYSDVNISIPTTTLDSSGNLTGTTQYDPGSASSVVVLQMLYAMPVLGDIGGFSAVTTGTNAHLLVSTSVIKVEPSS